MKAAAHVPFPRSEISPISRQRGNMPRQEDRVAEWYIDRALWKTSNTASKLAINLTGRTTRAEHPRFRVSSATLNIRTTCAGNIPSFNSLDSNAQDEAGCPFQRMLFSSGAMTTACTLVIAPTAITAVVITDVQCTERAPAHPNHEVYYS